MIIDGITTNDKGETLPDFTYKEAVEVLVQGFCAGLRVRPQSFTLKDGYVRDDDTTTLLLVSSLALFYSINQPVLKTTIVQDIRLWWAFKRWRKWRRQHDGAVFAIGVTKAAAKTLLLNKAARDARLPSD